MRVEKWSNSLAVRLPVSIIKLPSLREGDEIEIGAVEPRRFEVAKKPESLELLAHLHKHRGRLPNDFKFDRLSENERG